MIKYGIGLVLSSLPVLVFAVQPTDTQDYKCHVTSTKGDKVLFYRWKLKDANLNMASLPSKQKMGSDKKKYFIEKVVECVPLSQEFTREDSKVIDALTLR